MANPTFRSDCREGLVCRNATTLALEGRTEIRLGDLLRSGRRVPPGPENTSAAEEERQRVDDDERAIQFQSFAALAWVALFAVVFAWLVLAYQTVLRTTDCVQFVVAPHDAPPPSACKRHR
jgi:hypothetical protein